MAGPLVSIIIPCYGYAHLLPQAIDSALGQTYRPVEVIVVNDGSPDDTAAVAARYGDRIRYIEQANAGVGAARNRGIEHARGEWLVFLDADDMLAPTMVQEMLAAAAAHPGATVFCGGWTEVEASGVELRRCPAPPFEPDPFHSLLPFNPAPPVCYLFDAAAIRSIGGFNPLRAIMGHEDWELLLRLAASDARFVVVPRARSIYRVSAQSLSANRLGMLRSGRIVVRRAVSFHRSCPECQRRLRFSERGFGWMLTAEIVWPKLRDARTMRRRIMVLREAWEDVMRDPSMSRLVLRVLLRLPQIIARHAIRRAAERHPDRAWSQRLSKIAAYNQVLFPWQLPRAVADSTEAGGTDTWERTDSPARAGADPRAPSSSRG